MQVSVQWRIRRTYVTLRADVGAAASGCCWDHVQTDSTMQCRHCSVLHSRSGTVLISDWRPCSTVWPLCNETRLLCTHTSSFNASFGRQNNVRSATLNCNYFYQHTGDILLRNISGALIHLHVHSHRMWCRATPCVAVRCGAARRRTSPQRNTPHPVWMTL